MRRLVLGAAAAGGAAFALRGLARRGRRLHAHCRETMRKHCGGSPAGCKPT